MVNDQMTNYAQIYLIFANCGWIYGQKWPDLWSNEIVGMAMAMVAMPDFTSVMMTLGLILISLVVMCCSMSTLVLKLITRTFEFLLQKHKFSSFTKFKSSSESGLQQLPQLFCLPAKVP